MASLTLDLWERSNALRYEWFSQGDSIAARCGTEIAALALMIAGIAESIIHTIGGGLSFWLCFIPSDAPWKETCFSWIENRMIALEACMVTTCCCFVQLFTIPWEDVNNVTLERARVKLQSCLALGFTGDSGEG